MDLNPAYPKCRCKACIWTFKRNEKIEMAKAAKLQLAKATAVLEKAIRATELHVQKTSSSQNNSVPDTIFDQKTAHDGDGVYRFLYRIFALPLEIRELVWCFACGRDQTIRLAGSEVNGIISAMLALEDPHLRSEGMVGVWKSFPIEWERVIDDSRAWQRFRKTVIPHIRCLTINFSSSGGDLFNREAEIGDTVAWMERRGKRGNRARYTWHLEQLHLIGLVTVPTCTELGPYIWDQRPVPGRTHWSEHPAPKRLVEDGQHPALKRLVKNGVKVTVETKHDNQPALSPSRLPFLPIPSATHSVWLPYTIQSMTIEPWQVSGA